MKRVIAFFLFAGLALSQVPTVPNSDHATVRAAMNTSLQWLDSGKPNRSSGTVDPGPRPCAVGDSYTNTSSRHVWWCVGGLTPWLDMGFGGGSSAAVWGQITGSLGDQPDVTAALAGKANTVHGHAQSDITGLISALASKENAANKGAINGYASLGADGLIPFTQLPPLASATAWGGITGTLANQADLAAILAGKEPANANIQSHIGNTNNPHSTTATQIGLGQVTNAAQLKIASNLSDLNNVGAARTNMGLGGAAVMNVGTTAGTVAAGDHTHTGVYAPFAHVHPTTDITSGIFPFGRLGTGGSGGGALVLYDDGVWRTPPGSSGGEANTASNTGSVGVGMFKLKSGQDLQFYKLNAASSKATVTLIGTDRVDVDVVPSAIDHQTLLGSGSNTHAQIDSHISNTSNPHNVTAAQAGAVALTVMTTLGDLPYRDGSGWQRLAGSTTAARRLLCQTGNGSISAAPSWCALSASDIPDLTGTYLPVAQKGAALGLATLDAGVKMPIAQVPTGTSGATVALGNHTHSGVYEPVDATILRQGNLAGSGSAITPARSDHGHVGVYAPVASPVFTGTVTVTPAGGISGNASFSQGTVTTPAANTVGFQAPTSVASAYLITLPGAPAAGFVKRTGAAPSVESVAPIGNSDLPTAALSGVIKYVTGAPLPIGTSATNCVHEDGSSGACTTGSAPVYTSVTFSATPTFTVSNSAIQVFTITLTGNVTSSTLATTSATPGQDITLNICQDGTGGHTFVPPTNVTGMGTIIGTASTCSRQDFRWDGANAISITSLSCPACASGIVVPGATSGVTTVIASATASGTLTLPAVTDTVVGQATVDTLTNKTIDAEATGNLITIPIKVYLAAATCQGTTGSINWDTTATLNPTATCSAGATATTMMRGTADFPDLDGSYNLQVEYPLPADWVGAVDMKVFWRSTATTGDVIWQVATACAADGAVDDVAFNTTQNFAADTAKGTTLQVNTVSLTGLTMTGCAPGSLLHVKLMRDRTTAADTIAGVVSLIGAELTMRRGM